MRTSAKFICYPDSRECAPLALGYAAWFTKNLREIKILCALCGLERKKVSRKDAKKRKEEKNNLFYAVKPLAPSALFARTSRKKSPKICGSICDHLREKQLLASSS